MAKGRAYHIREVLAGQTLAAALRGLKRELSWGEAKQLIASRRVSINGNLCLDDGRRVKAGEVVHIFEHSRAAIPTEKDVRVVHVDADLIVVEKPAGVTTLRHREERDWPGKRKQKQQTLDEMIQSLLPGIWLKTLGRRGDLSARHREKGPFHRSSEAPRVPKVRPVHRLDRDTSGLMLFALSPQAEQALVKMFKEHVIERTYRAVVHGVMNEARTIKSWLVRDRGDGLRGSVTSGEGREASVQDEGGDEEEHSEAPRLAVTHIRPIRRIGKNYTIIECRLETGRTHQIRIHLSEIGHMLCGEKIYTSPAVGAAPIRDTGDAPRHALHSWSLRFTHPITGKEVRFTSDWPRDLRGWVERIQQ